MFQEQATIYVAVDSGLSMLCIYVSSEYSTAYYSINKHLPIHTICILMCPNDYIMAPVLQQTYS